MNLNLMVVFSNLIGLFLLLGTGYVAVKRNIVDQSAIKPFSALLLQIALPCMVFTSMLQPYRADFLLDSAIIALVTGVLFLLNILVALLLTKLFRVEKNKRGLWCILVAFCNNGFMGFPVTLALFGEEGLALAAMIGIPFNLLFYSASAYFIGKDAGGGKGAKLRLSKVLFTPINAALVLGLLLYLVQVAVPDMILSPVRFLGNVTTPLSMFVTGMSLAQVRVRSILRDKDVWVATVTRLLLLPAMALLLLGLIPFQNQLVPSVILIILSMPAAAVVTSIAESYGGDSELAAKVIFLTSLLCILTIPIFAMML